MSAELLLVIVIGTVIVVLANVLAKKVGVAGPLILVAIGVAIGFLPVVPPLTIAPQLILVGVLPPLLYSAAVSAPAIEFRRDSTAIGALAVLLVIVSSLVLGVFFWWAIPGLELGLGIALGAILSPTDAVATSIIKKLGAPQRVLSVLEGESLLNDATALVTLRTAVAAVAVTATGFSAAGAIGSFLWSVVCAILVGGVVGLVALRVRAWTRSSTANTALGLTVPYLAYLPTDALGGSGIVAAVVAGIVCGQGAMRWLTPEQRISDKLNWRTIEFVLEGAIFLIMGLELYGIVADSRASGESLWSAVWIAAVAFAVLLVVRAAFVYPLLSLHNVRVRRSVDKRLAAREALAAGDVDRARTLLPALDRLRAARSSKTIGRMRNDIEYFDASPMTWKDSTIVVWAGMRGVVTLAAAQTLPYATPERDLLILVAFLVSAGSLLLQGLTLGPVMRALRLAPRAGDNDSSPDVVLIREDLQSAARRAVEERTVRRAGGSSFPDEAFTLPRSRFFEVADPDAGGAGPEGLEMELALIGIMRRRLGDLTRSGQYSTGAARFVLDELDAYEISLKLHLDSQG